MKILNGPKKDELIRAVFEGTSVERCLISFKVEELNNSVEVFIDGIDRDSSRGDQFIFRGYRLPNIAVHGFYSTLNQKGEIFDVHT